VSVPPPHLYRREALALGRDADSVAHALDIRYETDRHGAESVYTLGHLAHVTGAPRDYLRDVVARRRDPYIDIDRPKRDGRTRAISSPEPVLMDVQRWILRNMLTAIEVHPASYAYQKSRSIVQCAEMHLGARWLIKLDIHHFFDSIQEKAAYRIFNRLGYPPLLSLELTRLCSRVPFPDHVRREYAKFPGKAPYAVSQEGHLPQGAPTSGAIANAAMFAVDEKLSALAHRRQLVYTRYSDDLAFSSGTDTTRRHAAAVINDVSGVLEA